MWQKLKAKLSKSLIGKFLKPTIKKAIIALGGLVVVLGAGYFPSEAQQLSDLLINNAEVIADFITNLLTGLIGVVA